MKLNSKRRSDVYYKLVGPILGIFGVVDHKIFAEFGVKILEKKKYEPNLKSKIISYHMTFIMGNCA